MQIIGIVYIADYLTRDEMKIHSIKTCKLIQKEFNSYEYLIKDCKKYFKDLGYDEDRTSVYEMLKNKKFSYQLDWDLNLE